MENASKALIMAASVLLGVMIMTVGVALFNSFSGFSTHITTQIEKKQIAEFNSNFYKYYGQVTTKNETTGQDEISAIKVTAHDIVSVANNAKQNNTNYELENQTVYSNTSNYIQVNLKGVSNNVEKYSENEYIIFLKDNSLTYSTDKTTSETKYYKCTDIRTNELGRVVYIAFSDYK